MKAKNVKILQYFMFIFLLIGIIIPIGFKFKNTSVDFEEINNLKDISGIDLNYYEEYSIDNNQSMFFNKENEQWFLIDYQNNSFKSLDYLSHFQIDYSQLVADINYQNDTWIIFDNLLIYNLEQNQMNDLRDVLKNNFSYKIIDCDFFNILNLYKDSKSENESSKLIFSDKINHGSSIEIKYYDWNNIVISINSQNHWIHFDSKEFFQYKINQDINFAKINYLNKVYYEYDSKIYKRESNSFMFVDQVNEINYFNEDIIIYEKNNINFLYSKFINNSIELNFKYKEYIGTSLGLNLIKGIDNDIYLINPKLNSIIEFEDKKFENIISLNNNHYLLNNQSNQYNEIFEIESDYNYDYFFIDESENNRDSGVVFDQYIKLILDGNYIQNVSVNGIRIDQVGQNYVIDFKTIKDVNHKYEITLTNQWGTVYQAYTYFYVDYQPPIYIKDLNSSNYLESNVYVKNTNDDLIDGFKIYDNNSYQIFFDDWLIDSVYLDDVLISDSSTLINSSSMDKIIHIIDKFGNDYEYSLYQTSKNKKYWYETIQGQLNIKKSEYLNLLSKKQILKLNATDSKQLISKLNGKIYIGKYDSKSYSGYDIAHNIIEDNDYKKIASNKTYISDELFNKIILDNKQELELNINSFNNVNLDLIDDIDMNYDWDFKHYFYLDETPKEFDFNYYSKVNSEYLWGYDFSTKSIFGNSATMEVIPLQYFYYSNQYDFSDLTGLQILETNIDKYLNDFSNQVITFSNIQQEFKNVIVDSINEISEKIFIDLNLYPETSNYDEYDLELNEIDIDWVDPIQTMNLQNIQQFEFTITAKKESYAFSNGTFVIQNPLYIGIPEEIDEENDIFAKVMIGILISLTIIIMTITVLKLVIGKKKR